MGRLWAVVVEQLETDASSGGMSATPSGSGFRSTAASSAVSRGADPLEEALSSSGGSSARSVNSALTSSSTTPPTDGTDRALSSSGGHDGSLR